MHDDNILEKVDEENKYHVSDNTNLQSQIIQKPLLKIISGIDRSPMQSLFWSKINMVVISVLLYVIRRII